MFFPFFKLLVFIDKHNAVLYQRNKKIANKLDFFEEKAFFRVKVADICCLYFIDNYRQIKYVFYAFKSMTLAENKRSEV